MQTGQTDRNDDQYMLPDSCLLYTCTRVQYRYEVSEKTVSDGLLSVLQISAVQDSDFATYNCSAYNAYGSAFLPIKFTKKGTGFRLLFAASDRTIILQIC